MRRPSSLRWWRACARSCSARSSSRWTRRRCRCSIPVAGAPRPATSGRWRATTGRGATSAPPAVAYSYAPGRGAEHAIKLLAGYCGIVQCDGYAAYKQLVDGRRDGGPALAFCWAHWRRRFYEIAKSGPAPIAQEALARIAALYAIEKRIRGRSADGTPSGA